MSSLQSLDLKNLHIIVMQEFETEDPQELSTDFFRNLSNFIGKLKNEEYDGIEKKTKNQIISTATNLTELLINRRLEKIFTSSKTSYRILTDEEKDRIKNQLKTMLGNKLTLNFKVDKKIIGGLIVKVGSKMIDTSLANKINKLKIAMKGA